MPLGTLGRLAPGPDVVTLHVPAVPGAAALIGDAELDEGNIFEAMLEGWKQGLRNCWWIIDYNRQSLDAVVRDLCHREISRIVAAVQATTPLRTRSGFAPAIDQIVRVVGAIRDDELFSELWRGQPEFLLPYVFDRLGSSQLSLLNLIAESIEEGQADGWVREGDPDKLAAMVLLITQAAVQSQAVVEPILGDSTPLYEYAPGTWGPPEADKLTARDGGWHKPGEV